MTTATIAKVFLVPKVGDPWQDTVFLGPFRDGPFEYNVDAPDAVLVQDLNGGPARTFRRVPGTWRYEEE